MRKKSLNQHNQMVENGQLMDILDCWLKVNQKAFNTILNQIMIQWQNGNTIEINGIYEQSKTDDTGMINLLNLNDNELDDLISKTADITSKPILYQLSMNTEISTCKNTLPIQRKIYDKANMEMYELYLQVKELNPKCEFVGIKNRLFSI